MEEERVNKEDAGRMLEILVQLNYENEMLRLKNKTWKTILALCLIVFIAAMALNM